MSPTIRVDDEVYDWLKGQAVPFEDTPNSVLRRIAGLDDASEEEPLGQPLGKGTRKISGRRAPLIRGNELIRRWKIPVLQARFHRDGHYYEHLTKFPAAFCDPKGYVVFEDEETYRRSPYLRLGVQVNVEPPGISSIPGYREVEDPIL
ncbi:MAG: hypothetical protein QNJ67_02935 [Kiloniellales bacterium]|nr:hypothetical protein [Kiloniellales bacterium]